MLGAAAAYIVVVGVALLVLGVYAGDVATETLLAFGGSAAVIAAITLASLLPRLRRLREATRVAAALAELRFDERAPGANAESGSLASALNAASVNI